MIYCDQKINRIVAVAPVLFAEFRQPLHEQRATLIDGQIGREVFGKIIAIRKWKMIGVTFHEEIKRIHHRHIGDEINGDFKLARFFGEHKARDVVAENILLPVDEVLFRLDVERVRQDGGAAMRRRAQPYLMRRERDQTIIAVVRLVMQGDLDTQRMSAKIALCIT